MHRFKHYLNKSPKLKQAFRTFYFRFLPSRIKKAVLGANNSITHKGSRISNVVFDIIGDNNTIVIENGCLLNNVNFYIRGSRHRIIIGRSVRFNRGGSVWVEDTDCTLTIGEYTTFEDVHLALTEPKSSIHIGRDCMFAYDIDIRTGDSHSIISGTTGLRLNYAADIKIGDHVWVAAHSNLLKGTELSNDSIVATGSVVTRKFDQSGIIVAGNPAKVIKNEITWRRDRIYQT